MKYLKEYHNDYEEFLYTGVIDTRETSSITDRELKSIKKIFIKADFESGIKDNKLININLHPRTIVIFKDNDDYHNSVWYKCDQMHGLKSCIEEIKEVYNIV